MANTNKTTHDLVGEVVLYGGLNCGYGFVSSFAGRTEGDGEPVVGRSATIALWLGLEAIENSGLKGPVSIISPTGLMTSVAQTSDRPYYGDLGWVRMAPVYVLSAEEILAASEESEDAGESAGTNFDCGGE